MEDVFAASELSISQMTDNYSLHDQGEVLVSLQDAKFNLQMQAHTPLARIRVTVPC